MSIRSVYRSKTVIAFSILLLLAIVATAVMRAGVTEAQERAATKTLQTAPSRVVIDGHYQVSGQPGYGFYGQRPYTQTSPAPNMPDFSNMPPGTPPGFSFGFNLPQSTAAPMTEGDRRAAELANRIRQARDKAEREQLRGELREVLSMAFDQRREQQLLEIEQLQQQLASIRELDEKRQQRKDEIVQRRISELLSEPDALDWEPKRFPGQYGFPPTVGGPSWLPAMPAGTSPPIDLFSPARTNQPNVTSQSPDTGPRSGSSVHRPGGIDANGVHSNAQPMFDQGTSDIAIPSDAKDTFIFKMNESIVENISQLRRLREILERDNELTDEQQEQHAATEARLRSSIESGLSVWRMIGKQKERELEAAERALELARRRLEITTKSHKQGMVPEIELLNETATFENTNTGVAREKDRLAIWNELDKQIQDALNGVDLLDHTTNDAKKSEAVKGVEPKNEDGARRHQLFYQIRISYSVSVWWKPVA